MALIQSPDPGLVIGVAIAAGILVGFLITLWQK